MHNQDSESCHDHSHHHHGGSCGVDGHCENTECFEMNAWVCGKPQPLGAVLHNGHLYVNLVEGNLTDPALGVGQGTYAGAFDLFSLIQYVVANP